MEWCERQVGWRQIDEGELTSYRGEPIAMVNNTKETEQNSINEFLNILRQETDTPRKLHGFLDVHVPELV